MVMQNGALRPGNILDNTFGLRSALTIDDAWRAARSAAFDQGLDTELKEMFTSVSNGGATFSGGNPSEFGSPLPW